MDIIINRMDRLCPRAGNRPRRNAICKELRKGPGSADS